jgi:hypothetical protein
MGGQQHSAQPLLPDMGTGLRLVGRLFQKCCPEACPGTLGLWLSQSPHSRQSEYKFQGKKENGQKRAPCTLACQDWLPLNWTQFLPGHRAGLEQDSAHEAGEAQAPLQATLALLSTSMGSLANRFT